MGGWRVAGNVQLLGAMEAPMATSLPHRPRMPATSEMNVAARPRIPAPAEEPSPGCDRRLERVLEALESDRHRHLLAPSTEEDLRRLERAIQRPLPAQYRFFLARLGGGLYYDRHEVFGAARLMIHDIELVPDVLAVRERLAASCGVNGSPFLLPLHRSQGTSHWLDIRDGSVRGPRGIHRPSVADFLEAVVLSGNPQAAS